MPVSFEGFPRLIDRAALRPGRWFLAADGARPLVCFATDEGGEGEERLVLTFSSPRPEAIDFATTPLKGLSGPLATLEHEVVFTPGLGAQTQKLTAPSRRPFRPGALLRLRSGDLGVGFAAQPSGELVVVSFSTGQRAEGYDLVFDRWSFFRRRGAAELLVGHFRPL